MLLYLRLKRSPPLPGHAALVLAVSCALTKFSGAFVVVPHEDRPVLHRRTTVYGVAKPSNRAHVSHALLARKGCRCRSFAQRRPIRIRCTALDQQVADGADGAAARCLPVTVAAAVVARSGQDPPPMQRPAAGQARHCTRAAARPLQAAAGALKARL